jgi:peroxiredoxin
MRKWITGLTMVLACSAIAQDQAVEEKLTIGDHAREFEKMEFIQGEAFTLEENRKRRVTLVEFWATWCAPCKDSAENLSKLYDKYGKSGLVVIGITDETSEEVKTYLEEMGDKMNYIVATSGGETQKKYFDDFDLQAVPYAFLIDKNGRIVWYGHPMNPYILRILPILLQDIPEEFWPVTEKHSHDKKDESKE